MKIDFLADHPNFVETLAPQLYAHWRPILPQDTVEDRIARLKGHLNTATLPIALVAYSGSQVFGTAALRVHDLPGYEHLTPWLGGVFVATPYRGQGIGAALCATIERIAASRLGISTLYLFTLDKQAWYQRLEWQFVEPCTWRGQNGAIMRKKLHSTERN